MKLPDYFIGNGIYINEKSGVYAVVNPAGEIYVGQSVNIPAKIRGYKKGRIADGRLKKSIFIHGRNNHKFYLLENIPEYTTHLLWEKEKYFIFRLKSDGYTLLNSNNGGGGSADNMKKRLAASIFSRSLMAKQTLLS